MSPAPADPPAPERLRVHRGLAIPLAELSWRFSPSGGPGGQHANRAHTRAEVRFDIAGSPSLGPVQRARLQARLGDEVRVVADDERSQARNRAIALERLRTVLAEALRVSPSRRPTAPTAAARQRRRTAKEHRSRTKQLRQRPPADP